VISSYFFILTRADTYLFEHGLSALDDIASPVAFAALWEAQIIPPDQEGAPLDAIPISV